MDGRVVMITGAARGAEQPMGFGGASARLMASEGALVAVTDLDAEGIAATAQAITAEGGRAMATSLDVTSDREWGMAIDAVLAEFGRLDVLVNSAGTVHHHTIDQMPLSVFSDQMNVHAKGVFLGTKRVVPIMRDQGGGVIVNVASMVSHIGAAYGPAYAAGKGAATIFTKATAIAHACDGIRANSVHPGWCHTPLSRQIMAMVKSDEEKDPRLARIPMGRLGTAEEVASAILFLASDDSSYMTGAELFVDGGVTAQ